MEAILDGTNIDISVFSYSAPKAHASGGKVVNLYNKHFRESLTISTPLMLTWGAQEGMEQGTKKLTGKWTMALQFPSSEYNTPEQEQFLNSMRALEHKVKTDAMANSKEWFGKNITSMDVIEEKFNVMLKHPKVKGTQELDLNKPPTLTIKIPCWNGTWKPEIYDEDGEPLYVNGKVNSHMTPLEFLKPKTHVICLIQCGGLWFVNGKISITWNLKQAIVQRPKQTIVEGQCFLRPKASDKERLKTMPPPEDIDPEGVVSASLVDDSDDEEEHKVNEIPAPVPVQVPAPAPLQSEVETEQEEETPKIKKKITRKKAT